jgi:hypothetical protein
MDEDGKVAAKEEVVAEQDDEALVEGTKEGQWQANPRYTTTTNTPTKRPARFTCLECTEARIRTYAQRKAACKLKTCEITGNTNMRAK